METIQEELNLEYKYVPAPGAEEMLTQVWDIILVLLIEDAEKEEITKNQGETC